MDDRKSITVRISDDFFKEIEKAVKAQKYSSMYSFVTSELRSYIRDEIMNDAFNSESYAIKIYVRDLIHSYFLRLERLLESIESDYISFREDPENYD